MSELSTVRIRTNDGGRLLGGLDFCFYLTLIGTNKNFWEDAQNVLGERWKTEPCHRGRKEVGGRA